VSQSSVSPVRSQSQERFTTAYCELAARRRPELQALALGAIATVIEVSVTPMPARAHVSDNFSISPSITVNPSDIIRLLLLFLFEVLHHPFQPPIAPKLRQALDGICTKTLSPFSSLLCALRAFVVNHLSSPRPSR
jgi:hypothetical protein